MYVWVTTSDTDVALPGAAGQPAAGIRRVWEAQSETPGLGRHVDTSAGGILPVIRKRLRVAGSAGSVTERSGGCGKSGPPFPHHLASKRLVDKGIQGGVQEITLMKPDKQTRQERG